ncbi:MAG: hypothetical protein ACP5I7_07510 [Sulfolobales archaeon]
MTENKVEYVVVYGRILDYVLAVVINLFFIFFFTAIFIGTRPTESAMIFFAIIIISLIISTSMSLYYLVTWHFRRKRLDELKNMLENKEIRDVDLEEELVEIYDFRLKGYYRSSGRNREYILDLKKDLVSTSVLNLGLIKEVSSNNSLFIRSDGVGVLKGRMIILKSKRFRDIVIIPLDETDIRRELTDFIIKDLDMAHFTINIRGCRGSISINIVSRGRARSYRYELVAEPVSADIEPRRYNLLHEELSEATEKVFEIGSCNKIVLLSYLRDLDPRSILGAFSRREGYLLRDIALGRSDFIKYKLRVIMDIPFGRDVVKEIELN